MVVEVFLPLTNGLLIKSWDHTNSGITHASVKCAALIIGDLR